MRERFRQYLLWPFLSIIIFIFFSELVLHLIGVDPHPRGRNFTVNRAPDFPDVFLKDRELFWRLRPNQSITSDFFQGMTYKINHQGFRGDNFDLQKDGLRIAVLGNSCAFGWGVKYPETFAAQLEQKLIVAGLKQAQVYNFSVPGYSSFQGKENYSRTVISYRPDVILITFGWNDQWQAAKGRSDKDQLMLPEPIIVLQNLLSRLRIYRFFKGLVLAFLPKAGNNPEKSNISRVSLNDFKNNLNQITRDALSDGTRVVFLTSPIPSVEQYYGLRHQSVMHITHKYYNEAIKEVAAQNSVGLVDLAAIFDAYHDLFDDVKKDPFHYNRKGHAIASGKIYNFLSDQGFLSDHIHTVETGSDIKNLESR